MSNSSPNSNWTTFKLYHRASSPTVAGYSAQKTLELFKMAEQAKDIEAIEKELVVARISAEEVQTE